MHTTSHSYSVFSSQTGQTLVEILMVLTILIIVIFGLTISVNFGLQTANVSKNRTLATHYATEGIELMRSHREQGWDQLLVGQIAGTGVIAQTPFTRTIDLSESDCTSLFDVASDNEACVEVSVQWVDGSKNYQIAMKTLLTNW